MKQFIDWVYRKWLSFWLGRTVGGEIHMLYPDDVERINEAIDRFEAGLRK